MRFIGIIPLLCAIVAFTLSLLVLFAGSKPGYIEDAALLTVRVPASAHGRGLIRSS